MDTTQRVMSAPGPSVDVLRRLADAHPELEHDLAEVRAALALYDALVGAIPKRHLEWLPGGVCEIMERTGYGDITLIIAEGRVVRHSLRINDP